MRLLPNRCLGKRLRRWRDLTWPSGSVCERCFFHSRTNLSLARIDVSYPGGYDPTMSRSPHQSHPEILKRLRRANGHLRKVIVMIEEGRSCLDLAQQLHVVESAVREAKKTLVHDHLDHCLESAIGSVSRRARVPIDEFKAITNYL